MRLLRVLAVAALLSSTPCAAAALSLADQSQTTPTSKEPPNNDGHIIVTGHRNKESYRLPPPLRTLPNVAADRWRDALTRGWSCRNVGPVGCGLQPNRLLTFHSDGTVEFGDPGAKK